MEPQDKTLIRTSWAVVAQLGPLAAELFYKRLFEVEPRLRTLFAEADMVRQHGRLVDALSYVICRLDRLDEVVPVLQQLGRRHQGYGVGKTDYTAVGAALLWTLQEAHGDSWTDPLSLAWQRAYRLVADAMQSADDQSATAQHASGAAVV